MPHLIWSIQPPHVQTRHGYYASSADTKQGTGKLKSQETKEVAGEWKNKWWLPPVLLESGDMLHVISVSWYAVVRRWCAGQGQFRTESRAQGWQEAKRSNCSLSPNKYMDEWTPTPQEGRVQGSKRGNGSFWSDLWTARLFQRLETLYSWHRCSNRWATDRLVSEITMIFHLNARILCVKHMHLYVQKKYVY